MTNEYEKFVDFIKQNFRQNTKPTWLQKEFRIPVFDKDKLGRNVVKM